MEKQYVIWTVDNAPPKGELGKLFQELYEIKLNGLEAVAEPLLED